MRQGTNVFIGHLCAWIVLWAWLRWDSHEYVIPAHLRSTVDLTVISTFSTRHWSCCSRLHRFGIGLSHTGANPYHNYRSRCVRHKSGNMAGHTNWCMPFSSVFAVVCSTSRLVLSVFNPLFHLSDCVEWRPAYASAPGVRKTVPDVMKMMFKDGMSLYRSCGLALADLH